MADVRYFNPRGCCCIYCSTGWDGARAENFIRPFEAAQKAIKEAERAMLVLVRTVDPRDRARFGRAHKHLVRVRRAFNRTEHIRAERRPEDLDRLNAAASDTKS